MYNINNIKYVIYVYILIYLSIYLYILIYTYIIINITKIEICDISSMKH